MGTSTLIAGPMPKIGRTELAQIAVPEATRHTDRFLLMRLLRRWLKPSAFATSAW